MEIKPSEFNRLVTMKSYTYSQGDSGAVTAVLAESFQTWAKVVQNGGNTGTNQGQEQSTANYTITIRYRPGVTENWNITYEGLTLKIGQLQIDNPAYKRYLIISCNVTIQQSDWS